MNTDELRLANQPLPNQTPHLKLPDESGCYLFDVLPVLWCGHRHSLTVLSTSARVACLSILFRLTAPSAHIKQQANGLQTNETKVML